MKIDFDHWKGAQIGDDIQQQIMFERTLSIMKTFNPTFSKDGNQYCFLYGELPNDCVVGFGDTAFLAMIDFVKNFDSEKAANNPIEQLN